MFNYAVQALFIQPGDPAASALTGLQVIENVQSHSLTLNYPREDLHDVNLGGDTAMVERPTVQQEFSYLLGRGVNEERLGFASNGATPCLIGLDSAERNTYTVANIDHHDLAGYAGSNVRVLALGQGALTSYSVNCAVGQVPTASVVMEGLNLLLQNSGISQLPLPAIDKRTASGVTGVYSVPAFTPTLDSSYIARPRDLYLNFDTGCSVGVALNGATACALTSFSLNVALPRHSAKDLGWAYPECRPLQLPITVSLQAQGTLTDYQVAALNQADPEARYSVELLLRQPGSDNLLVGYMVRGLKLESQSFTAQVGGFNQATFSWSASLADLTRTGPTDPNFYVETYSDTAAFWVYSHSVEMTSYDGLGTPYTYMQDYYTKVSSS
jgi:hypothetical protein